MKYYLAIDIGASSGRHIVGWKENGSIKTKEVYRFSNGVHRISGHLIWDVEKLVFHVKEGIAKAKSEFPVCGLSIDTWGVDYVLLKEGKEVLPVYAYRDDRTEDAISQVHDIIPFAELYHRTGTQFQPFNTVYQLYADKLAGRLDGVTDFLMIPEYIIYKLCGKKVKEYTNATTTGMVNADTHCFDSEIISRLGLPGHIFPDLSRPGDIVGEYDGIKVFLCATHDTGSAVEGIPMCGNHLYLSSGTWSLLGIKTEKALTDTASMNANFSNEGGVGYNRYQKNIMGMWLINELKKELCPNAEFSETEKTANESQIEITVDADAKEFLSPGSMRAAFDAATGGALKTAGDYFRCAYLSLARSYAKAIREIEANTGKEYENLYIVGGGAKNAFLNQMTERATGKTVIALPIEATALGNLKMQMEATLC